MKRSGQIVLASFPYTDLSDTKLRPVLMLRQASANFDNWRGVIAPVRVERKAGHLMALAPFAAFDCC